MRKRQIFEGIHKYIWISFLIIFGCILVPGIYVAIDDQNFWGLLVGLIVCGLFFWSCFRKFKTEHNYALLKVGDTLLDITYRPGDWIIALPGYKTVQEHNGKLLTTKEMSIKKNDVQFEYGGENTGSYGGTRASNTDSVKATVEMNYYLNRFHLYSHVMRAPEDYENTLLTNACADLSASFQNRIGDLDEAQAFRDITFTDDLEDYPEGIFLWDNDPKVIAMMYRELKALYEASEADPDNRTKAEAFNRAFFEIQEIPALNTTIRRAEVFAVHFNNITISDYADSDKNEELRSSIQQETLVNERKKQTRIGNQQVLEEYCQLYESKGYSPKEALAEATKQLARDNKSLQDFNVSGNGGAGVILDAGGRRS
ncbi:MAG: hypothetical protein MRY57_01980 [Candidatus Pacebacteria bacterium]|nr:hypothetical protein [Candidatus Paceibacterota bacterium]